MRHYFKSLPIILLLMLVFSGLVCAQDLNLPTPREEKLLNGLDTLIWKQDGTGKVSVSLRIHSGSAFDPQGKEGTMALLSDILFPDPALKNYFEEDLEGKLEVIDTYDYIQINATAKSDEFLTVMQTLAQAVTSPPIDKETLDKVKAARLQMISALEQDPKWVADRAVAKLLFGDFPYGRKIDGTKESLEKIDFAELVFARSRFLTADNATLAIAGDVQPSYAYRAARRLFGGWQKSLNKIPANFRLPDDPDKKLSVIPISNENVSELRFASKTIARNDPAFFANLILARIIENRMYSKHNNSVELKRNLLPSYVVYNFSDWKIDTVKMVGNAIPLPDDIDGDVNRLFEKEITESEFSGAKNKIIEDYKNQPTEEIWFNVATYKLKSIRDDWSALKKVKPADVRAAAEEWKKETRVKVLVVSKVEAPQTEQEKDPKDPR